MHLQAIGSMALGVLGISVLSCSDDVTLIERPMGYGELSVAISSVDSRNDVTDVRIDVVSASEGCAGAVLATKTVPLSAGLDDLFILPPGDYRVCASPLAGEVPSVECAPTAALASVTASEIAEVTLVSQCNDGDNGGIASVVVLNDAPSITLVTIDPSESISVCESAELTVVATDADGDALSFEWTSGDPLSLRPYEGSLRTNGASATFSATIPGDYVVNVAVRDSHGGSTALSVPVHVAAGVCSVVPEVQQIFLASCGPCHTTGMSGGLKLDTAQNAYANLVGQPVRGAACTSSVRVVPGAPAASYLIAKLRGLPGICGVQMPRNQPPLPEERIQLIEAWIAGLPH